MWSDHSWKRAPFVITNSAMPLVLRRWLGPTANGQIILGALPLVRAMPLDLWAKGRTNGAAQAQKSALYGGA